MKLSGAIALVVVACSLLTVGVEAAYTHCKNIDSNSRYRLHWDMSTPNTIRFMMQAETAGWIGLGLSNGGAHPMISNGNMSDIWVGWVDSDKTTSCASGCVYDYYVSQYQQPTLDPRSSQSLTFIGANFSAGDGMMSVEFSRPLVTGDSYDQNIDVNGITTFIWALNPSSRAIPVPDGSSFLKHNADTKGSLSLRLNEPSQCSDFPTSTSNSFTNSDGSYKVGWSISSADKTITFTITASTKGWVGLGLSHGSTMVNSDMYVGWLNPNTGKSVMTDRYATQYAMPPLDTSMGGMDNVLSVVSGSDGDSGATSITFTRALDTGDTNDVVIEPGSVSLLWAYGSDSSVDYTANTFKQHVAMGITQIDLFNGCTAPPAYQIDLYRVHGVLMVVSIGLLLFPGMLLARYFKNIFPKWFYMHAALQILGYAGIICAFAIIFVAKGSVFTVGVHQVFGLIAFIAYGLELLLGLLAHFRFNPNRANPPVFPDKTHWWLGRLTFVWSLITIYLGMRAYNALITAQVLYLVWIILGCVGVVYLQKTVGQTHESSAGESKKIPTSPSTDSSDSYSPKHKRSKRPIIALMAIVAASIGLLLIGYVYKSSAPLAGNLASSAQICVNFNDFVIPSKATSYICRGFVLPADTDYHITQFDAIKDNQEMLHHMILYQTDDYVGDGYFDCNSMPKGSSPLFAWAVGMGTFAPPSNVGFRIGKSTGSYVALQIHYDNPNQWADRTDSSGVKLTMTPKLRPIDAGYFVTGITTKSIRIPANKPYYEMTGTCDTQKFSLLKDKKMEFTIFATGLHMHTLGRQIYTEQFRPDPVTGKLNKIGTVGCDDYFSFNDQKFLPVNATLKPGDQFVTHCIYDSSSKTTATRGCESTDCEMCINYMAYYPRLPVARAGCSGPPTIVDADTPTLQCDV